MKLTQFLHNDFLRIRYNRVNSASYLCQLVNLSYSSMLFHGKRVRIVSNKFYEINTNTYYTQPAR